MPVQANHHTHTTIKVMIRLYYEDQINRYQIHL